MADTVDGKISKNTVEVHDIEAFYTAAVDRDIETISQLVEEKHIDINYVFSEPFVNSFHQGGTILHIVVEKGKLEVVKEVISLGGNVCFPNKSGDLPIHIACKYGNKKAVHCLLAGNHLCTNVFNYQGLTPIMRALFRYETAFRGRYLNIINSLIMFDCNVNLPSPSSLVTPLHMTSKIWDPCLTAILLSVGANVNALDKTKMNPLLNSLSTKRVNPEIIKLLVEAGADLNFRNPNGKAPLHIATSKSDDLCVEYMLRAGADPNIQTNTGSTPLWIAVVENNLKIARLLIAHGADTNRSYKNDAHETLLSVAVQNEYIEMTQLLLQECDLVSLDQSGETGKILSNGIRTGNMKIIKMLLYKNFPLEGFDDIFQGISVLAFGTKFLNILKLLVLFGLKIDVTEHIMSLWEIPEEFLASQSSDDSVQSLRSSINSAPCLKTLLLSGNQTAAGNAARGEGVLYRD